jgi:3-methyladenine DNA glycosylase AlkD
MIKWSFKFLCDVAVKLSSEIFEALKSKSDSYRKQKIAEYMRTSSLKFIGVELPDIHATVKQHTRGLAVDDLVVVMEKLWKIRTFETRVAAIDVLKDYARKANPIEAINIANSWIDEIDTWGISDPLCSPTIGIMLLRNSTIESNLKAWRTSDNFWRRRCSVLPYLYLSLKTQYKPEFSAKILEAVTPHISDEEFFVGKAAGWVLRELSKRDPESVSKYFGVHRSRMTRLVLKEGSRKL